MDIQNVTGYNVVGFIQIHLKNKHFFLRGGAPLDGASPTFHLAVLNIFKNKNVLYIFPPHDISRGQII